MGTVFRVERSAWPLGLEPLRAEIFDPDGHVVWTRARRPSAPVQPWPFRTTRPGLYRIVYRRGSRTAVLETLAATCTPTLRLGLDDDARSLFTVQNARPGVTKRVCVRLTYTGNAPARVRLYGRSSGTGLAKYLRLTVIRGWTSRRDDRLCRSFRPDRRNYLGVGAGIVYAGPLAGLPPDFASAPNDATSRFTRTWRRGASHAYELVVTLPADAGNDAQGLTAGESFVWEARPTLRGRRGP